MKTYLLVTMFILVGCVAGGGGGSFHLPPEVKNGQDSVAFEVQLSLAGDSEKNIHKRYTNIQLRIDSGPSSGNIEPMVFKGIIKNRGIWRCVVDGRRWQKGLVINYSIISMLDGNENVRKESLIIQ